jgi:hypothetical protein
MRTFRPLARISLVTLLAVSCASSPGSGGSGGSGGSSSTGGTTGTGGTTSTGGTQATGGTNATGGVNGTGGTISTGGTTGTGGASSTGGTNGTGGSGGAKATGGTTGTGGAAGHGGQTGGTGGATATGGSSGATGGTSGAGVLFSDDFESDTSGKQPANWDNLISYNYKTTNPMGSLSALADATQTHGGSKLAAHFVTDGSGSMVFLEHALPSGTNHLFVRAYVYLKKSIGDSPASASDNHETLMGLTMTPNNGDNQLRFGQAKGAIGMNQVPSDDFSPVMAKWNSGPTISASMWHCVELEFDGTAAYNTYRAWSDGTLVDSIASSADWAHGTTTANWMNGYFNSFMMGWQSFSSMSNEVWIDDLVLATARVGCN